MKYIQCVCGDPKHTLMILQEDDGDVFFYIHLSSMSFWKRLWYAFRYVCGKKSRYGCFEETILTEKQVKELRKMINE